MSGKTAPFPVTPELTAIAIAYRNPDASLIADDVMPRVRPVSTREFRYTVFDLSHFDRPNTYVGRRGVPNEVSMGAMEETAAIEDYGLDEKIPQDDIDQAARMNRDLSGEAVEYIMNLVKLDREVRVANLVQDTANYGFRRKPVVRLRKYAVDGAAGGTGKAFHAPQYHGHEPGRVVEIARPSANREVGLPPLRGRCCHPAAGG